MHSLIYVSSVLLFTTRSSISFPFRANGIFSLNIDGNLSFSWLLPAFEISDLREFCLSFGGGASFFFVSCY